MARKGDFFLALQYCEKLWFVNGCGKIPRRSSVGDREKLEFLHRSNINIFWSRDTATMKGILGHTKEIVRREREGGMLVPFSEINDWPVGDKVGIDVAIQIMEKYLCKGRNGRD